MLDWASFHPLSNTIISCENECIAKIWSFSDHDLTCEMIFLGDVELWQVEVHPKANQIISISGGDTFKVWDDYGDWVESYTLKGEK